MKRRRKLDADQSRAGPTGTTSSSARLLAAIRHLATATTPITKPHHALPPEDNEWAVEIEARLTAIESAVTNQNRLLLLTLIGIAAEALVGIAQK